MGSVFKARHQVLGHTVAIKMLSVAGLRDQQAVERFQREVRAVSRLKHPNIVAALDADQAGGQTYLVLEFVQGVNLAQLVKQRGPVAVDVALQCIIQAARGLENAHQEGIVHRDIKPANLVLDEAGVVKILDMGLARVEEEEQDLTSTGQVVGTVTYMSPEQALSTKHVDARADMYSLGCTLHYLLTGNPPYKGETAMQTLLAHRTEPIPDLQALLPTVSPQMQAVYARMMAKNPHERYANMTECLAALESLQGAKSHALQQTRSLLQDATKPTGGRLAPAVSTDETGGSQFDITATNAGQPPWFRRPLGLLSLGGGGLVLLLTVVFMLRTPSGMLVIEINEPGATVTVDGQQKVLIHRPGDQQAVQVEVDQQQHELKVTKDGFQVFTQQFSMQGKDEQSIRVRLEPLAKPAVPSTAILARSC